MKDDRVKELATRALKTLLPGVLASDTEAAIRTAYNEGRADENRRAAEICEYDSSIDWAGGSTGNGPGTAKRCAAAIRAEAEGK